MAHDIRIVTEADLREHVALDLPVVDAIEAAFAALASDTVIMPPILSMDLPHINAEVDVKTAFISGFDSFAIKVSPGFFDNPTLGLASLNGLMILFSAKTGLVEAVFLDNGYLTDIRTAAAGAVAARHLAPKTLETAGVIGTGVQARLQIQAAHLVRPFSKALVYGRDAAKANACAQDISDTLGINVRCAKSAEDLVAQCQLVVTTTPARVPVISVDWLHSGLHITAMGSDAHGKNELDPRILRDCTAYVCDSVAQCKELGELRSALDHELWPGILPPELGQIISGAVQGRQNAQDITVCDLTGTGAQDTAIASHAYGKLAGAGTTIAI